MCFRYFNFSTFEQVDRLTFPQVEILSKVARLKEVDRQYLLHEQSYLNLLVKSTDYSGKRYKYSNFDKFFDYEDALNKALGTAKTKKEIETSKGDGLLSRLSQIKKERREKPNV